MAQRGFRTIKVTLGKTETSVYTSPRVADALNEILEKATLYDGVKISQILEACYKQGKKDGSREVFDELERNVTAARKKIPHANPGRPRRTS